MNGGHSLHFDNGGESTDEELIEALKQVGALRHARILAEAIFLRNELQRPPQKDREGQEDYVAESIENLDSDFGRLKPDIPELLARYFDAHPESFPKASTYNESTKKMFADFQGVMGEKGDKRVRLFKQELLDEINREYEVGLYLPGYLLLGSDSALEGIFVAPDGKVVQIPFVPMSAQYEQPLFDSLEEFRAELDRTFRSDASFPMELTRMAIHPIALGGSPTDPANFKDAPEEST